LRQPCYLYYLSASPAIDILSWNVINLNTLIPSKIIKNLFKRCMCTLQKIKWGHLPSNWWYIFFSHCKVLMSDISEGIHFMLHFIHWYCWYFCEDDQIIFQLILHVFETTKMYLLPWFLCNFILFFYYSVPVC
jgi:hypothetical protein